MDKTREPEPCPFCGGENLIRSVDGGVWPEYLYAELIAQDAFKKYVITCTLHCEDCGASMQGFAESNDPKEELYYKAIEDCYGKWNDRAERTCYLVRHGSLANWPEMVCWSCSECSFGWHHSINDKQFSYCPNCGAKVVE